MDNRIELKLLARDGGIALGAVVVVFLLAYGYTGNWPPMVVVESGSMEHDEPSWTRIGTIDTGDLVLVKQTDSDDIVTYFAGKRTGYQRYGDYGDVIIYFKNGLREYNGQRATPVIHRAMAWVDVYDNGSYYVREIDTWFDGELTISEIGAIGLTDLKNSGYLTKGDNNPHVDQRSLEDPAGNKVQPVRPEWIEGQARGELPWFGLIKLRLTQPENYKAAPKESKRMLLVGLVVVIGGPFAASHLWERWKQSPRASEEKPSGRKDSVKQSKSGKKSGQHRKKGKKGKRSRKRKKLK